MRTLFALGLSALVMVASSSAFAQQRRPMPTGLERYSDSALLREMSYRGFSCEDSQRGPETVIGITCNQFTEMVIELYTEEGVKLNASKIFMGSQQKCASEKSRILAEVGPRISRAKTVAYCNQFTEVVKLQFNTNSVKEVEKTFSGSAAACESGAQAYNDMF